MDNRSILITGCSSGIGLHAARFLRERGWRVLATCRKEDDAARLRAEGLESWALDLASDESVAQGAARALDLTGGRLFALFNNGAFAIPGASEDIPRDGWRAIFETNLFGQIDLTNRVLPAMRAAGRGRIVNNSSVLGFIALRYRGAYIATKHAMEGWTNAMRLENTQAGIHFVTIQPGPITSAFRRNARAPFETWVRVQGSAHAAAYETEVKPRLYDAGETPDRFELGPEAVSRKLERALTRQNPPPRYLVTTPTYLMDTLRRILPDRLLDAVARRG